MKMIARLLALGICGSTAFAQPGDRSQIDVKARIAGTTEWLDVVNFTAPAISSSVDIEIGVFYFRNAGYGFATTVHNLVTHGWFTADVATLVDRADSAIHPDGRQGNFNKGGQAQDKYTTGIDVGNVRVSARGNPADAIGGGITIKQGTPIALGASFNTTDGFLGFRFDITLNNATPGIASSRTLISDAPFNRINSYTVYANATTTTATSIKASLLPTDVATINISWAACFTVTGDGDTAGCPFAPAAFTVTPSMAGSYTYQWQFRGGAVTDWTNLTNGSNSVGGQFILNASGARTRILIVDHDPARWPTGTAGQFRCLVSQDCGSVYSVPATLTICGADYDCDGFVTGDDFDAYHEAFAAGIPDTDFDGDGFVTGDDFDAYVLAFEAGC